MRIRRHSKAHSKLRSFASASSHVSLSAFTLRADYTLSRWAYADAVRGFDAQLHPRRCPLAQPTGKGASCDEVAEPFSLGCRFGGAPFDQIMEMEWLCLVKRKPSGLLCGFSRFMGTRKRASLQRRRKWRE